MSILQMSFSASILILVIIVIRALAINRLPKKTFLAFWAVALLRLLIPFSFPSPFSVYSVVSNHPTVTDTVTGTPAANLFPITAPAQMQPENIASVPISTPAAALSWWTIIWFAGIALCSLYFVIAYVKCYREFLTSTTIENDFIGTWLAEHKIMRPISIRQSTRISAPLTYGIFRPVILLPPNMDWSNEKQLQYILAHEYTHIRRFDTVTKLFLTAALCIHWFNPLVWAMYILSNRDIELSCDETVVCSFGETIKTAYALALVGMEERRSVFSPYYNSFSKNAIEERIVAIMKIKKTSLIAIGIAIALLVGVTTVFATSAKGSAADSLPTQNTTAELPKDLAEKYAPLLALRFDGYKDMTISEYQEKVWETIGQDESTYLRLMDRTDDLITFVDENENQTAYYEDAHFILEILLPIISDRWQQQGFGNAIMVPNPNMQTTDVFGQIIEVPDASAQLGYEISYTITDANVLTVGECEQIKQDFQDELYRFLQGRSVDELQDEETMVQSIESELDRLKTQWEKSALQIVDMSYIFDPLWIVGDASYNGEEDRGTPGTEADYRSALSLMTADYQNQSVADFNYAVLEWSNDNFDTIERIRMDLAWNDVQVELTDEEQVFLTLTIGASGTENHVLIMSEKYGKSIDPELHNMLDKEQYPEMWCGLDYTVNYYITDENRLTVGERDRCLGGIVNSISAFWEETSIEELITMSEAEIIAQLETIVNEYSNDLIKIELGQTHFETLDERAAVQG